LRALPGQFWTELFAAAVERVISPPRPGASAPQGASAARRARDSAAEEELEVSPPARAAPEAPGTKDKLRAHIAEERCGGAPSPSEEASEQAAPARSPELLGLTSPSVDRGKAAPGAVVAVSRGRAQTRGGAGAGREEVGAEPEGAAAHGGSGPAGSADCGGRSAARAGDEAVHAVPLGSPRAGDLMSNVDNVGGATAGPAAQSLGALGAPGTPAPPARGSRAPAPTPMAPRGGADGAAEAEHAALQAQAERARLESFQRELRRMEERWGAELPDHRGSDGVLSDRGSEGALSVSEDELGEATVGVPSPAPAPGVRAPAPTPLQATGAALAAENARLRSEVERSQLQVGPARLHPHRAGGCGRA